MLDLFLKLFNALSDALPKFIEYYKNSEQDEQIIQLLESYYILGDLICTAESLITIVRGKDKIDLSTLSLSELEKKLNDIEARISIQRIRLKRLSEIYSSNPVLDLLDSNIQFNLKKALGSKWEGGIHGFISVLHAHQACDFAENFDGNDRDWTVRANNIANSFIIEITDSDKSSVNEQDAVLQQLKDLREIFLTKLNEILDKKDKTIIALKAKELANKYAEEHDEYFR